MNFAQPSTHKKRFLPSISMRITLPIIAILVVALSFLYFVERKAYQQNLNTQYAESWEVRANVIRDSLGPVLNSMDIALAQWIVDTNFKDERILFLEIRNSIDAVLYTNKRVGETNGKLSFSLPILSPIDGRSMIGTMIMNVEPYEPTKTPTATSLRSLVGLLTLGFVSISVLFIVRQRAIKPLSILNARVEAFKAGDEDVFTSKGHYASREFANLDESFYSAITAVRDSEREKNLVLAERGMLSEAANTALNSGLTGIVCHGRDASDIVIRAGLRLPERLLWMEEYTKGRDISGIDDELSERSIKSQEIGYYSQKDSEISEAQVLFFSELQLSKREFWRVSIIELADNSRAMVYSDISLDVKQRNELVRAQKMESIGKLTGGVAHDFNNLLMVIQGNIELFIVENREFADLPEILNALSASHRGTKLTRNLLTFSRESELTIELTDLNQVVNSISNWVTRVLPDTIHMETILQSGLWHAETDASMTENVILNLIINARDAMPEGGALTVETSNMYIDSLNSWERGEMIEPGRYVMIAISDTGSGIEDEVIEKIFDPFFTTKAPGKGTGMGLSMVQGFMHQIGGTVRVYSEIGEGSTFKLLMPAGFATKEEETPRYTSVIRPTPNVAVLLAEDDSQVRSIVAKQLSMTGYNVTATESGDAALALFKQDQSFDIIVTDISMSGSISGLVLAREVRKIRPNMPVVYMSGYAQEAAVHGNGVSPNDIRLMKPVERIQLVEAIEVTLKRNREGS